MIISLFHFFVLLNVLWCTASKQSHHSPIPNVCFLYIIDLFCVFEGAQVCFDLPVRLGVGCEMSVCSHTELAYYRHPYSVTSFKSGSTSVSWINILEISWISDTFKVNVSNIEPVVKLVLCSCWLCLVRTVCWCYTLSPSQQCPCCGMSVISDTQLTV